MAVTGGAVPAVGAGKFIPFRQGSEKIALYCTRRSLDLIIIVGSATMMPLEARINEDRVVSMIVMVMPPLELLA